MAKMLSKLNLKDYNNELETVLEKKAFSIDAKNLLLSMLYKIEVGYKDYKTVKRDVTSKEGFIETIINAIDKQCEEIEFIVPKEGDTQNYKVDIKQKKIICYQNEISLFEAILEMSQKNFLIDDEYLDLSLPMQELLQKGYAEDKLEVMAAFDGWSWNPGYKKMYDSTYFYCYQVLRILKGNSFLYDWKRDRRHERDYLLEIRKYSENLYWCIYKIAISLFKQKNKIMNSRKIFEKELARMDNKSEYLKEVYTEKRKINNTIKKYDKMINDKELLCQEFNQRNESLAEEKKIFSVSDLVEVLQKEREEQVEKLQEVAALADPKNYIEKARRLKDKIELINQAQNCNLEDLKKELGEIFMACLEYELEKSESKKEILEVLYNYRYACYLTGKREALALGNKIIEKACKLKLLTILHEEISYNSEIIDKIISNSIIELENINLILRNKDNLEVEIYDGETFDRKEELEFKKGFTIKFGKKIKLVE